MLGDFASVGIYTIGYSLAINVSLFMSATLNEAFIPVAIRMFGTDGAAAVRELKGRILLPMTYASIGVAVMLRSEEHTSELQSLMRISYAVFCLKKKKQHTLTILHTKTSPLRSSKSTTLNHIVL